MRWRCLLAHDWEYFSGDCFDDAGQRCRRCGTEVVTRHALPRPPHVAADPSRRPTATQRDAAAMVARPAVCTTDAYAPRSSTGGRVTSAQRDAMRAAASSARRRFARATS